MQNVVAHTVLNAVDCLPCPEKPFLAVGSEFIRVRKLIGARFDNKLSRASSA